MSKLNIEGGELEMLALGQLSARREQEIYLLLERNEDLRLEFEAIQEALERMAFENAVKPPAHSGANLHKHLFSDQNESGKVIPFYKSAVFKVAASILFVGSILTNIILLNSSGKEGLTDTAEKSSNESRKEAFMAALPMESEDFEEMFDYLHVSLEENPCDMKFTVTRRFLRQHNLNEDAIIKFLNEEGGHCDCEVLMNVSMQFPQEPYRHGNVPKKTHREADIKLAGNKDGITGHDLAVLAFRNPHVH